MMMSYYDNNDISNIIKIINNDSTRIEQKVIHLMICLDMPFFSFSLPSSRRDWIP